MSSVFGVICAGKMVRTDFETLDSTHLAISLLDADSINHLCVFMTGSEPFPEHLGGSVYICWSEPNVTTSQQWHYLGFICNQKPSAIFKVSKLRHEESTHTFTGASLFTSPSSHSECVAHLGISIEPLNDIAAKTPAPGTEPSTAGTFVEFSGKMVENFAKHVQSFAVRLADPLNGALTDYIPASAVNSCWTG